MSDEADDVTGEPRWPASLAILFLIVVPLFIPERLSLGPKWVFPAVEALFLGAIIISDPGRIDNRSRLRRMLSVGLIIVLLVADVAMTGLLVRDMVHGSPDLNEAVPLLATGGLVWINNIVLFGLVYWELDCGGAAERAFEPRPYPDLMFPEHLNPEIRPPGWRPVFLDYLYVGLTNGLAFSPTDVMPHAHWAKIVMGLQSLISVAVLSLVVARAVNILT